MVKSNADNAKDGFYNRNPLGKNQHGDCPSLDDEKVATILRDYNRRNIVSKKTIKALLLAEHNIKMSEATITRRRQALGLHASGATTKTMSDTIKRQLILDQMAKDPTSHQGPRIIKENIALDTGIHLTRDWITMEMRLIDPSGFESRSPTAKRIHRVAVVALGPHYRWSGDGHDKLVKIGWPIWGVRDVWSGKWLGLWVVPDNRLKVATAYLFLKLVEELGGMPIQMVTDCGSETTKIYGVATALREIFNPDLPVSEFPAHRFMRSVNNITIERGWLRLRLQWGDNVLVFWEAGRDIYNPTDPQQYELVQWLWSTIIQKELDTLKARFNDHKVRFDADKLIPSGVSPNVAYSLMEKYGGEDCLQPVDITIIKQLKEELGGDDIIRFVGAEYEAKAVSVFHDLGLTDDDLSLQRAWHVFSLMLPLMPL
ncbi:hypothetical protein BJ138DRAFT_1019807 [Hygrophoropsis aurantiaca]|uniref:Uncharacterized protein n=1 Tax=Hygrophoropsis aurantiaca TaxID=72124 RepID=A0ACB7ZTD7_9AGAM|nr:hypothetical protein BJ138DRAFT_1019807 [Hygrophoropsis aurantiaca]